MAPFQLRLEDLAQDLASHLRVGVAGFSERPTPGPASGVAVVASPHEQVFLAGVASDVAAVRDAIHLELRDAGVMVSAPAHWSDEASEVERELGDALAGKSLSVQIVGAAYGSQPDGAERSLPEFQFDRLEALARQRPAHDPLVRIVWIAPGVQPKSERQRAFIEKLRHCEAWGQDDELLTGSQRELAERITAKRRLLAERREARQRAHDQQQESGVNRTAEDGTVRRIYVISEPTDHARAHALEHALSLASWEVLSAAEVTQDNPTERERERQHQEYLDASDAFVIYHGEAKFRWVRAQADEARKAFGRRGKSTPLGAVYVAQPLEGVRATYRLVGLERLDELDDKDVRRNVRSFLQVLSIPIADIGSAE